MILHSSLHREGALRLQASDLATLRVSFLSYVTGTPSRPRVMSNSLWNCKHQESQSLTCQLPLHAIAHNRTREVLNE